MNNYATKNAHKPPPKNLPKNHRTIPPLDLASRTHWDFASTFQGFPARWARRVVN